MTKTLNFVTSYNEKNKISFALITINLTKAHWQCLFQSELFTTNIQLWLFDKRNINFFLKIWFTHIALTNHALIQVQVHIK